MCVIHSSDFNVILLIYYPLFHNVPRIGAIVCPLQDIHRYDTIERGTIEINWTLSDRHFNLVTFWSSTLGGARRSSVETQAVNQNRNARWADPEERLFGLTLDLGQGARMTPAGVAEGRETGNSTANQIPSLFSTRACLSLPSSRLTWTQANDNVRSLLFTAHARHHIPRVIYRRADV